MQKLKQILTGVSDYAQFRSRNGYSADDGFGRTDAAFELISRAIDAGRPAHGYLLVGDLKESCDELAQRILFKLFPDEPEQIAHRGHPDVATLVPEGASRTIKVDAMRERIVEPMSVSAFSGGWKVGIIVGADRMQPAAANAFLKTLEEPPPKTLFLLLTDQPDGILPTIVSRTQRVDLPLSEGLLEGEEYDAVAETMAARPGESVYRKAQVGKRLAEILGELKDAAENEDVPLVRKRFFKTVMRFVRGWALDGSVPRHRAFDNVEAVEEAYRQCERYMPDEPVLCFLADRLAWPAAADGK